MLALRGIYQDGQIHLDQSVRCNKPVAVIVTFLEDELVLEHSILTKINSLQAAVEELRTLCTEENYEWQIPERQNRLVEF
jgi:hypothetical protein